MPQIFGQHPSRAFIEYAIHDEKKARASSESVVVTFADGRTTSLRGLDECPTSIGFHPSGQFVFATSTSARVCVWNISVSDDIVHPCFSADFKCVLTVVFSPSGRHFCFSADYALHLYTFNEGNPCFLGRLPSFHYNFLSAFIDEKRDSRGREMLWVVGDSQFFVIDKSSIARNYRDVIMLPHPTQQECVRPDPPSMKLGRFTLNETLDRMVQEKEGQLVLSTVTMKPSNQAPEFVLEKGFPHAHVERVTFLAIPQPDIVVSADRTTLKVWRLSDEPVSRLIKEIRLEGNIKSIVINEGVMIWVTAFGVWSEPI